MPTIDFQELLGSTRADGKLILSNLIKAFVGRKVVQDVRDSTNAVEIDLEDEVGDVATVSIPKGAAIDAVARQEAEDAQAAIDAHEADHPGGRRWTTDDESLAGQVARASRGDHVHNVPHTTLRGISEKAT